jgi:hypothetical protein
MDIGLLSSSVFCRILYSTNLLVSSLPEVPYGEHLLHQ